MQPKKVIINFAKSLSQEFTIEKNQVELGFSAEGKFIGIGASSVIKITVELNALEFD